MSAIEERIDADLALGRHQALVGELETLIRAHRLRERLRAQLMLALYRSDRQADALSAYQDARRMLDDELGLEPSESLRRLERAILAHDPELDPPAPVARVEPDRVPAASHPARQRPRGRRVVLAAALLAVAAVVIASVTAFSREEASTPVTAAENSLGIVDSTSNALVADVAVGATPTAIAHGDDAYWVTNADDHTVSRVDPNTRAVVQTIAVGSGPSGITTGKGDVWVVNSLDSTVTRIDTETNTPVQRIEVGNFPLGIAYANGAIWVANTADDTITKIDADTGKRLKTLPISATELSAGGGALWASQRSENRVSRIDPATGKVVQAISVGIGPTGIDVGAGSVWVANSLDGTVSRIDPETNTVTATLSTGDGPVAVAAAKDGVWVSNQFDGTVVRIDPGTSRVARRITVGNRPQGVAFAGGNLLVGVRASDATHRGGTLTIRNDVGPDSIDPAVAYDPNSWPYMQMTNDGLVAFNQVAGLGGTQLVPDLAVSLPAPTDGGRTYTFKLRQGIRYSTGRRVRASDVRSTFERAFRIGLVEQYYDGIVGAADCRRAPKRCDLSRGIVTDDAAGTVAFHLVEPDPEFLYQLAIPHAYVLPKGTPARNPRARPLPATGPYTITKYEPSRVLRLERNPYFREWSKAAQPDGYPDTIVLKLGGKRDTADKAIEDVLHGKADLMSTMSSGTPSPSLLTAIKTRYPSQVHVNLAQQTGGLFLNTRLAPFDRLAVRRAVSYAVDRATAVQIQGGPILAEATCQVLPPHYPGYRRYCPYTARPTSAGTWTAPDLRRARELVAGSGTKGMNIKVWDNARAPGFGRLLAGVLDSLGYRASVKTLRADTYSATAFDPRTRAQIGFWGWGTDYPLASPWFSVPLTCASLEAHTTPNWNAAQFCDTHLDRMITKAQNEQLTNPDASRRLWERIDRYVVDRAPYVPLIEWNIVDVLGKNVGNYQFSGRGMGMLIDQLWVQ